MLIRFKKKHESYDKDQVEDMNTARARAYVDAGLAEYVTRKEGFEGIKENVPGMVEAFEKLKEKRDDAGPNPRKKK